MNFIYFPKPGRKYDMPELLKDEGLEVIIITNNDVWFQKISIHVYMSSHIIVFGFVLSYPLPPP